MIFIDKDLIDSGQAGVSVCEMPLYGLERALGESPALPDEGELVAFRLYDGDGELYYEGRLTDDDEATNQSAALRWGEAMAGTAEIRVKRGRSWTEEI